MKQCVTPSGGRSVLWERFADRTAANPLRWRRYSVFMVSLVLLIGVGCRGNNPYGACTTRIPPPSTGSYAIPSSAMRSATEPYYQRSGEPSTTSVNPSSTTIPSTGQWQPATVPPSGAQSMNAAALPIAALTNPATPVSGLTTNSAPETLQWRSTRNTDTSLAASSAAQSQSASPVITDSQVRPASYAASDSSMPAASSATGNRSGIIGLLPVQATPLVTTEDAPNNLASLTTTWPPATSISPVEDRSGISLANDSSMTEPGRLTATLARPLPSEAGVIGSGVRSELTSASNETNGTSNGSASRPSVNDLLGTSQATWRPRL